MFVKALCAVYFPTPLNQKAYSDMTGRSERGPRLQYPRTIPERRCVPPRTFSHGFRLVSQYRIWPSSSASTPLICQLGHHAADLRSGPWPSLQLNTQYITDISSSVFASSWPLIPSSLHRVQDARDPAVTVFGTDTACYWAHELGID